MPYKDKEDKKKHDATYQEAHKEEIKARIAPWRAKYPIREMLYGAKRRAIAAGLSFDLVETDIHIPELCPVFETPLVRGTRKNYANSPSLDRIDSAKGYVRGNVWVISSRANTIKSDASLVELKQLVAALERRQRER